MPHLYGLILICAGSVGIQYCGAFLPNVPQFSSFFCLSFERAMLSPGVGLLRRTMALKENGGFSGIVVHLQGRQRNFTNYGALARKDATLSQ